MSFKQLSTGPRPEPLDVASAFLRLFDADDVSTYAEGKAIVAWVEDPETANGGVLGAEEGKASATYEGMSITYSGFGGAAPGRVSRALRRASEWWPPHAPKERDAR